MRRGPKPKATVVKLITGNPGRRPLNDREAQPAVEIPEPPSMLKGEALKEWERITPLLAEVGLISRLGPGGDRRLLQGLGTLARLRADARNHGANREVAQWVSDLLALFCGLE